MYFNPVGAHISGELGENAPRKPNNPLLVITRTSAGLIEEMTVFGDDFNTRDGSCIRDCVHVSDMALAHVNALRKLYRSTDNKSYDVINLGTGRGITIFRDFKSF